MLKIEFDENNSIVMRNIAEALTNIANETAVNHMNTPPIETPVIEIGNQTKEFIEGF